MTRRLDSFTVAELEALPGDSVFHDTNDGEWTGNDILRIDGEWRVRDRSLGPFAGAADVLRWTAGCNYLTAWPHPHREALAPFAAYFAELPDSIPDDEVLCQRGARVLTAADFRRAARALGEK